jgi:hypothetical protein
MSALLDDEEHQRAVQATGEKRVEDPAPSSETPPDENV